MNREVVDYVSEKTKELLGVSYAYPEVKVAGQRWLDAVGTENEADEMKKYLAEIEADIIPIDGLIEFASSEQGEEAFGVETAKTVAAHGKEIKAAGAKYCDCEACAPCEAILAKKEILLK